MLAQNGKFKFTSEFDTRKSAGELGDLFKEVPERSA